MSFRNWPEWDTAFKFEEGAPAGGVGPDDQQGVTQDTTPSKDTPLTFESFRKALPEDLRGEKVFDSFKTNDEGIADFAKTFIHGQRLVGKKKEELIPGENATDEERAQFYELMGRPQSAEGYGLTEEIVKETFPDVDMDYIGRFTGVSHNLGLTKAQVEGLLAWQAEEVEQNLEQIAGQQAETMNELTAIWGGATERHVTMAQRAVLALGGEELKEFMNTSGAGNVPLLVKAFAKVGNIMAEKGLIEADVEGLPSLDDAAAEANKIVSEKSHPLYEAYHDPMHANHDYAVERVSKLFEARYTVA